MVLEVNGTRKNKREASTPKETKTKQKSERKRG